jgi:two-component sensor histidine kinase
LTLVERLVKDELKGELKYTNKKGANFKICWS